MTRKQWDVFLLITAALHKFGKIKFKVLIATGLFSKDDFYDNFRNSRALIGYFLLSISGQTHELIIYAMRQRTGADNLTICYRQKQIDVNF